MQFLYAAELSFLKDVLAKSHLGVTVLKSRQGAEEHTLSSPTSLGERPFELPESIKSKILYKVGNRLGFRHILLLLPDGSDSVLCIGPFLESEPNERFIEQMSAEAKTEKADARYFMEYCKSLPVLGADSAVSDALSVFCERIWNGEPFVLQDLTRTSTAAEAPFSDSMGELDREDTIVKIKAIERRYSFENEMMRAVSQGRPQAESLFASAFSGDFFEKRSADPVRNAKNYSIIMNTLLRKAAESGGVHPVHLDRVSSEFAAKIESIFTVSDVRALMSDMFKTYCRLVRSMSLKSFSPLVQNAILIIEADLSADISPSRLAESLGVSLGYLSTVFRKQTDKTISQYILDKRMDYAKYILSTTNMQIQNVALHCGIMDVQYFSKLFKKHTGKTPTEYRSSANISGAR